MPLDDDHDATEDTVAEARSGVQAFSPAAFRRQRARRGFTLRELAMLSGVSAATISTWELGQVGPSPRLLAAVVDVLDIEIADVTRVRPNQMRLVDLRHQAGLSQEAAAAAAGMTRAVFRAIETGGRPANEADRHAFAALYGVDATTFDALWSQTRDIAQRRARQKRRSV